MKELQDCKLYAFVDTAYLAGRSPADVAHSLCAGGADIVQLRAKGAPKDRVRQMAREILPITNQAGVWLVINDFPDIAVEINAGMCHLGQEDFFEGGFDSVSTLGKSLHSTDGSVLKVGLSTHAPVQALRALAAGPDYIAIGPVFATGTKPLATPVTLEYVRWAASHVPVPWFAIGGITLENLDQVLAAGARRVCVVSAILNAKDIVAACAAFKKRLMSVPLRS